MEPPVAEGFLNVKLMFAFRRSKRQTPKILNKVTLLTTRKGQAHASVVMINDLCEGPEAAVVVEPALFMRK